MIIIMVLVLITMVTTADSNDDNNININNNNEDMVIRVMIVFFCRDEDSKLLLRTGWYFCPTLNYCNAFRVTTKQWHIFFQVRNMATCIQFSEILFLLIPSSVGVVIWSHVPMPYKLILLTAMPWSLKAEIISVNYFSVFHCPLL